MELNGQGLESADNMWKEVEVGVQETAGCGRHAALFHCKTVSSPRNKGKRQQFNSKAFTAGTHSKVV